MPGTILTDGRRWRRGLRGALMAGAILLGAVAWSPVSAAVVSPAVSVGTHANTEFQFRWSIQSEEPVAAVNGVLTYDPALFSFPRIGKLPATGGFNVIGNEAAPGRFHFVIYANPTAQLPLNQPIVEFFFSSGALTPGAEAVMHFKSAPGALDNSGAAARPDGVSFGTDVTFHPITIQVNTSTRDWALYE